MHNRRLGPSLRFIVPLSLTCIALCTVVCYRWTVEELARIAEVGEGEIETVAIVEAVAVEGVAVASQQEEGPEPDPVLAPNTSSSKNLTVQTSQNGGATTQHVGWGRRKGRSKLLPIWPPSRSQQVEGGNGISSASEVPRIEKSRVLNAANPRSDPRPRVVVSLTSLPSRLPHLSDVLASIKAQTLVPDAIYVCLPHTSLRLGSSYDPLPPYIEADPDITVLREDIDYGPATKLLPVLPVETDSETVLITVDDDTPLNPDHLRKLVSASMRFPGAAVGFGGWNVTCMVQKHAESSCMDLGIGPMDSDAYVFIRQYGSHACTDMVRDYGKKHCGNAPGVQFPQVPHATDVLEGVEGVAYRRRFFDRRSIVNYSGMPQDMFFVDDVWISGHLARRGVPRLVVAKQEWAGNEQSSGVGAGDIMEADDMWLVPIEREASKERSTVAISATDQNAVPISQVDSLHGSLVDLVKANYYSVRHLHFRFNAWGLKS